MNKYAIIYIEGSAYYSGATYSEILYLPLDVYETLAKPIEDLEIGLGELDGKHSEVFAHATVVIQDEDYFKNHKTIPVDDEQIIEHMDYLGFENDIPELATIIYQTKQELDCIYEYADLEIKISKKDLPDVLKFLQTLDAAIVSV